MTPSEDILNVDKYKEHSTRTTQSSKISIFYLLEASEAFW